VVVGQTVRSNPEFTLNNLQGATNYRFLVEAFKLGSMFASNSLDINISNDTTPATYSLALNIPYVVSTFAGVMNATGSVDAVGTNARFGYPHGLVFDNSGNLYVGDYLNSAVRKISKDGNVTTYAGMMGVTGTADAVGTAAQFCGPTGVAIDKAGNIYVGDRQNQLIRKISTTRQVSTIAGHQGVYGSTDGTGALAYFWGPQCMVTDSAGNLFVTEAYNHTVRKITPAGVVTTFAGALGVTGTAEGVGTLARFYTPIGIIADAQDNLYVADLSNHAIRKITPGAVVTTYAGMIGATGCADGPLTTARFNGPTCLTFDAAGNIFLSDGLNGSIRKISKSGMVTTLAGLPGSSGAQDGTGSGARFTKPWGIAVDGNGNIFVAEWMLHSVRVLR
jgi:sugar lactone lactonase YvrE